MRALSDLPPGCTARDLDDQTRAPDRAVPTCRLGEPHCDRPGAHRHCAACGGDHLDGECDAAEYRIPGSELHEE